MARSRSAAEHNAMYGAHHQQLRAEYARMLAQGFVFKCPRCGRSVRFGMPWQLDHRDDGGPRDYLGPAHARCNLGAGGTKGNARKNAKRREHWLAL